jgi:CRISPR-associated endonuclease/helicase Cas3
MSGIITFAQCLARPSNNGIDYWLKDHLIGVKEYIDNRIALTDPLICKLAGLAGICHDIAKAHADWQMYIRGKRADGPNHAPEGAFLFSYLGYSLLKNENKWPDSASIWLWLIRDIADHHGTLKSIEENRWIGAGNKNWKTALQVIRIQNPNLPLILGHLVESCLDYMHP